ncbi:MAG: HAMP domain-containing sensor histidine kinase [Bacillota bacterium]|jgi:two-component system sensor histidine kinase CiaH|nr:HAMP domain-containing sensor histidine kinase [Bacillota bacterium]HHU43461.1 HAMP domain-containing histidine kinase [Clostridiales bacterium]
MFKRLRKKMIISNMVLFGVLVLALLGTVFGLSYARMTRQIDVALEKIILSARNSSFLLPTIMQDEILEPNSLIVFVDISKEEIGYISDTSYYSRDFLEKMTKKILDQTKPQGRVKVEDRHIAYDLYCFFNTARIAVYDYTMLQQSITNLLLILSGAFFISLVFLFFIFRIYAIKAIEPIEDAFYKQKELVTNASHELKTPLTIISTSMSIINSNKDDKVENQKKWFDNINLQTQRMSNLINDMLDLAKVDSFKDDKSVLFEINLSELLQGALLGMELVLYENGINLQTDIAESLKIKGNKENVEKLLYIFIDNAVKYTPRDGTVWVSLKQEKRKIVFRIKNSGEGIPKDKMNKLFDRFYRIDEARTQRGVQSFGLGLSIAKSIIDSMGASINVESKANEYTEFIITFKTA